jgi:hypothetical protein
MRLIDRTGQRFGRLYVLNRAPSGGRRTMWSCRCDCGAQVIVDACALKSGATQSCGCLAKELIRSRSITHGRYKYYSKCRELESWQSAKSRCFNPKDEKYPNYGGRGITMHPDWVNDASAFLKYMGPKPPGTSLDRIDVNRGYEPGNCRWATSKQQARNRTDNAIVLYKNKKWVLRDLADHVRVSYKALHRRVRMEHQNPEDAIAALTKEG